MFEDRAISLWTYNLETLLAEKLETIMARSTANTRMRDFYDIHVLSNQASVDTDILKQAFLATSRKRNTEHLIHDFKDILQSVEENDTMRRLWDRYRADSFFVGDLEWTVVMHSVRKLAECVI